MGEYARTRRVDWFFGARFRAPMPPPSRRLSSPRQSGNLPSDAAIYFASILMEPGDFSAQYDIDARAAAAISRIYRFVTRHFGKSAGLQADILPQRRISSTISIRLFSTFNARSPALYAAIFFRRQTGDGIAQVMMR